MKTFYNGSFLPIILFCTFFSFSIARDTITPTQPLADNETLISASEVFALGFFTPPKSNHRYIALWYNKITIQTIVWVANRNNPITNSGTGTLSITSNGSLIITDVRNSSDVIWSTTTTGLTNPVAQLLDTGNLVVKEERTSSNTAIFSWQSFDYPTNTFMPGMKIGVDRTTGLNRTLVAWKSSSDPSPGQYYAAVDTAGDPEICLWAGSTKVWRSGPWVGGGFSGIPEAVNSHGLVTFSAVNNKQEVTFRYDISNQSNIPARIVVNQSGILQRMVWIEGTGQWSSAWYAPKDQCDNFNQCGPYGLCDLNNLRVCNCPQGFRPKNPANWALKDNNDGCVRKTTLNCSSGSSGFLKMNNAKLPDTSSSTVNMSLSSDECKSLCLNNCSCTAYAIANISTEAGNGCIIWVTELVDIIVYASAEAGQDLYLKLATADLDSTPDQSRKTQHTRVPIIVSLVLVVLLLTVFGCCLWRRERRKGHGGAPGENDLELPLFDLATIRAATGNFSELNKLGEGGFGPVYKGKLGENKDVAVKRLATTSRQGVDEFKNEVMLIAKLQHRNLVRLFGCCIHGDERMLVYEYMPNKSLDAFLFDKEKVGLLDWQTRYCIILGIARGLLYLHQDSRLRIIHRDLKTSNILLDKEMNPKISDFGTARILGEDDAQVNTRKVVGTYGYMSPEYAMYGTFSAKSDVYSFGVIILEIISRKMNRGAYAFSPDLNLVIHTWNLWNEGNIMQIIDESMKNSFPLTEVLTCIKIGLLCVQEQPEYRPQMSLVIQMLGSDIASLPEPTEPGFIGRRGTLEIGSSSSKQDSCSYNDLSITVLGGR